jgi:hypothetical protein
MRPTKALAISAGLMIGMIATAISMSVGLQGCSLFEKKVVTIADDVKTCFGSDVKGDLGDIVKGIGTALVCDVESGGIALPACTIEGLQTIAQEIGPSGKADVSCVVEKLAQDAAGQKVGASPEEVLRTRRAKLYVKARTLALRSPGDATPKTGPTAQSGAGSIPAGWPTLGARGRFDSAEVAPVRLGRTFAACDLACGKPMTGLVTQSGCSCWRASKTDWRASRWVPAGRYN